MKPKKYLRLINLARQRNSSPQNYFEFQLFQGALLADYLTGKGIDLNNQIVLDIGSGQGGYSCALARKGATVYSLDSFETSLCQDSHFVYADALTTPYQRSHFELVICASIIEHVPDPDRLLNELKRIMVPDGIAYISFPPFYSLKGGHQFSPFHLFGERIAIWALSIRKPHVKSDWQNEKYPSSPDGYAEAFGQWGLYRRTINEVEKLISNHNLEIIDRSTRWIPLDFSGIPILREFLTWHVQFLVKKKS